MSVFTNLERDLIKRTKLNLDFIQKAKNDDSKTKVYETTQLFNSLLGIIVNIKENRINAAKFQQIALTDQTKKDWAIPPEVPDSNLGQFLTNLRHSVAHLDVCFEPKDTGEIQSIVFQNTLGGNWQGEFQIENLRSFLDRLCAHVEEN
jgi:hypothetical protein